MPISTTTRVAPVGIKPDSGFGIKVAFALDSNVSFWEKSVKPPGADGGDPNDTSTNHNTTYRTKGPRTLVEITNLTGMCTYVPAVLPQIYALINQPGAISVHFWDGSSMDFWGYLKAFDPSDANESGEPEANFEVVFTNTNTSDGSEEGPEYNAPST